MLAYGHWGRPVLAFPSEQGQAWQYEERGMVDAIAPLIDAGRVKLYCVDSYDSQSWQRSTFRSRNGPGGTGSTNRGSWRAWSPGSRPTRVARASSWRRA